MSGCIDCAPGQIGGIPYVGVTRLHPDQDRLLTGARQGWPACFEGTSGHAGATDPGGEVALHWPGLCAERQGGLMMQVLLETGARVPEFVAQRVEDGSLAGRVMAIEDSRGGKRREAPMYPELAHLVALHVGHRRSVPLFAGCRRRGDGRPSASIRCQIGHIRG